MLNYEELDKSSSNNKNELDEEDILFYLTKYDQVCDAKINVNLHLADTLKDVKSISISYST